MFLAAVEREATTRVDEALSEERARHAEELERATNNGKEQALLLELNDGHQTTKLTDDSDCRGDDVLICAVEWNRFKEYGLLRVAVRNRTPVDVEYTRAQVFDEFGVRDHGRWALDGELTVAGSGGAEFADLTYENMSGDVLMDVTVARLQLGGQMHFGSKVQFVIRAGLGFQGVSHDSRFTPDGGTERDGPKSGFAFDMVGSLGGELDARLGKSWHLGASLTGGMVVGHMFNTSALRGSLETSLHLGYEWSR